MEEVRIEFKRVIEFKAIPHHNGASYGAFEAYVEPYKVIKAKNGKSGAQISVYDKANPSRVKERISVDLHIVVTKPSVKIECLKITGCYPTKCGPLKAFLGYGKYQGRLFVISVDRDKIRYLADEEALDLL